MEQVNAAVEELNLAKKRYLELCETAFEGYLRDIFKNQSKLDFVSWIGWTPGFNDGDPCTHSSEIMLSEGDLADWGVDIDYLAEKVGVPYDEDKEEYSRKLNDLSREELREISKDLWKFDGYIQAKYDTDFRITVTRCENEGFTLPENWEEMTAEQRASYEVSENTSGVQIEHEHYDCGY
jgi:hypothetical protein